MLSPDDKARFVRDGYLVVPGVLTPEQVSWLRAFFRPRFDLPVAQRLPGDTDHIQFDVFSRHPEARWLLFHGPALDALRYLLGDDFVVLRETAVHLNHFAPWHRDTRAQEVAGHRFHMEHDYLMVEAGYYLQPNSQESGGGLDVEPGTHLGPYVDTPPTSLISRGLARLGWDGRNLGKPRSFVSVATQPGDLVVFDFRLNHRGSVPARPAAATQDKMAVFVACSSNSRHVQSYHEFISARPDYVYLRDFSYPEDLRREAQRAGLTLA